MLEHLLIVGGVAIAFAAMLDTAPEVVIGVLCGTCIAVPASFTLATAGAAKTTAGPLPAPARPDSGQATSVYSADGQPVSQPLPSEGPSATVIAYKLARHSLAAGRYVVTSPIRLLLRVVALAMMLLAPLLSMALASICRAGWRQAWMPEIARHRAMVVENWPFVLRSLGGVALFVAACLTLALIMGVRRSPGHASAPGDHGGGVVAGGAVHPGFPWDRLEFENRAHEERLGSVGTGAGLVGRRSDWRRRSSLSAGTFLLLWPGAPPALFRRSPRRRCLTLPHGAGCGPSQVAGEALMTSHIYLSLRAMAVCVLLATTSVAWAQAPWVEDFPAFASVGDGAPGSSADRRHPVFRKPKRLKRPRATRANN